MRQVELRCLDHGASPLAHLKLVLSGQAVDFGEIFELKINPEGVSAPHLSQSSHVL